MNEIYSISIFFFFLVSYGISEGHCVRNAKDVFYRGESRVLVQNQLSGAIAILLGRILLKTK